MKNRRKRYGVLAFGVLWLVMTAFFSYAAGGGYVKQLRASRRYVRVNATGVSGEVKQSRGEGGNTHYSPRVTYRYVVGGTTYESDVYSFMGGGTDFREAHAAVEARQPGAQFIAFYDPASPHDAVLDTTPPSLLFPALVLTVFWGFGAVIIIAGVYGVKVTETRPDGAAA